MKDRLTFFDNATVVLDARSITQLLYMYSAIGELFPKKNTNLLWKGKESDLFLAAKLMPAPRACYVLDIDSKDKSLMFDFKTVTKIKNTCKLIKQSKSNIKLCTSFASGFYFELLKSSLSVSNEDIVQFDDGLINEIIVPNKHRYFKFIINLLHGFFCFTPRYKLFSDKRFKIIYSSINPNNIISIENKQIVDISEDVAKNIYQISLKNINIENAKSAILMTSHFVESGRMTQSEYQELIRNVYSKLKELDVKDVYLSKHPAEKHSNDNFYNEIGLILTYQDYPSELLVANKHISYIANPLNSTIMMSYYCKQLKKINGVVSYYTHNSPFIDERIKMIDEVLSSQRIKHYVL